MPSEPDRRTTYPWPELEPLLGFYGGAFSAAFIALHPFRDLAPMAPHAVRLMRERGWETAAASPHDVVSELLSKAREAPGGEQQSLWRAVDGLEKAFSSPIRWETVCDSLDLSGIADLNRALLTGLSALKGTYEDREAERRLASWCEANGIFQPTEGDFQPLMQKSLAALFVEAGAPPVLCGDEFGEISLPVSLETLVGQDSWDLPTSAQWRCLFAADRSLLVVVHWDSFFTLICGTRERLDRVGVESLFEGFWCEPDTTHLWWMTDAEREAIRSEG